MADNEDSAEEAPVAESVQDSDSPTSSKGLSILRLANGDVQTHTAIPERYRIRQDEEGRLIGCLEAPTLKVRIERELAVAAAAAKHYPPGTIFLDGAARGAPFVDIEKKILNLDHHEGCIRPFTLATCEQAYVVVAKGLDLQSHEWTLYASEPDLDTLLAIWVFLNYRRIRESPALRHALVPLLRLEGTIDVHGFDLREFTGFPPDLHMQAFDQLEEIRNREVLAKQDGHWQDLDLAEYTVERLRVIDSLLYVAGDFEELDEIEELARAELPERRLAIACRSEVGIYRVEEQLRKFYRDRLGLIALQKSPSVYTIRQVQSFSGINLERIYDRLNLIDPAAGNSRSANRWSGSAEIGGSPRASGTRLGPAQVVEACADASTTPTTNEILRSLVWALLAGTGVTLLAALPFLLPALRSRSIAVAPGVLSGSLLVVGALLLFVLFRHGPGVLGLRRPIGLGWLGILPLALLAAAGGGVWAPEPSLAGPSPYAVVASAGLFAVGSEILFRGAIYGLFLSQVGGRRARPRRALYVPLLLSSLLYAVTTALPLLPLSEPLLGVPIPLPASIARLAPAALFGLFAGWARLRSESLLPPLVLHLASAAALSLASFW